MAPCNHPLLATSPTPLWPAGIQENQLRNDGSLVGGAKGKLNRRKTKAEAAAAAQNHKKHKINVIKNPSPLHTAQTEKKRQTMQFSGRMCKRPQRS